MRHSMFFVNVFLLLAVTGAGYWRLTSAGRPISPSTPADLFMQSIANEDGALGWNQLCPELQAQLPRDELEQQTQVLRISHTQSGATLTIDHLGDRPRTGGGEIRVYVATERGANGSTAQKTYVVQTQASGCVESVQ